MDQSSGVPAHYAEVHKAPQGPGDNRPSAEQVMKDMGRAGQLKGKTILITGGSSGLGAESARVLYKTGAKIFITARQVSKAQNIAKSISTDASLPAVSVLGLELDSLHSVRACAKEFLSQNQQLNVLMTNAGVMAPPEGKTKDGFEEQFGVNHLAHFLLFQLLLPTLLASSTPEFNSRVVSLSSSGHRITSIMSNDYNQTAGYNEWIGYGQSKTCNVFLANEITRRYGSKGLHGLSLHPGFIGGTELARHITHEPGGMFDTDECRNIAKSIPQGTATQVWAAVSKDLEGRGGLYLDDVQVAAPAKEDAALYMPGYAPHAYDVEAAQKLWADSLKLVGVQGDA